jgi:hypothetical protein
VDHPVVASAAAREYARDGGYTVLRAATAALAFLLFSATGASWSAADLSEFTEIHDPDLDWSFGWAMAMSGNTLVVGNNHPRSGSVWIFERRRRHPESFRLEKRLASPFPKDGPYFGRGVEMDDDTIVVTVGFSRSVLVFSRHQGGRDAWGFVKRFRKFGDAAIDGDLLALGVNGKRVDIHQRDLGGVDNWGRLATIRVKEGEVPFAASVALSGRALVVGSAWTACGSWTDVCSDGYRVFEQDPDDPADWPLVFHKPGRGFGDFTGGEVLVDGGVLVSTDGIRERRGGRWDLVAAAAKDGAFSGLALRGHSVAHRSPRGARLLDRTGTPEAAWRHSDEVLIDASHCGAIDLGPREVAVACPHGTSSAPFGTVRIYPRRPLFADDFEDVSFARWTTLRRRVRPIAPGLDGSEGALAVDADGTARKSFVRVRSSARAPSVSVEFWLLPKRVRLDGDGVDVLHLAGRGRRQVKLALKQIDSGYRVELFIRTPKGDFERVGGTRVRSDTATRIGLEWHRASDPLLANGLVRLTKKGRRVAERIDLANHAENISVLTLGLPAGSLGARGGSLFFDSVVVHR